MLNQNQLQEIIVQMVIHLEPDFIILYDAVDNYLTNSKQSITFAFFTNYSMNPFGQSILAEELSEIVNAPIHLVDLAETDTELMADIFSKGRLIHCPDEERYKEERAKV